MTKRHNILEDFVDLSKDVAGSFRDVVGDLAKRGFPERERFLERIGAVDREEFDAVREMVENARSENDLLAGRIEKLKSRLAKLESKPANAAKRASAKTVKPRTAKTVKPRTAKNGSSRAAKRPAAKA